MSDESNVVNLKTPAPEPLAWVCNCGCRSFTIFADGMIECANCLLSSQSEIIGGHWAKELPPVPDEVEATTGGTITSSVMGTSAFAIRLVTSEIERMRKDDSLALVIGYDFSGRGKHWIGAINEDQRAIIIQCIEELLEYARATAMPE